MTGPLTAGSVALSAGTIGVAGSIGASGSSIALSAGAGGITEGASGVLNAGTVSLSTSGGGVTQNGGTIVAGTLLSSGGVTGSVLLNGSDTISVIGSFPVSGGDFTLADTGGLSVAGSVGASDISLNAGTIGIVGTLTATTLLALGASSGGITESGAINAGTLTSIGSVAGGAHLTGTNTIGALGSFAADTFTLNDGTGLTVRGPLTVATSATIVDVGTLLVSGTIAPSAGSVIAVGLTAGALDITGLVSDSGTGTTSLVSNAGTINETGTLIAGTLSGSAANGTLAALADLTGANGTVNQIGTLGAFTAGSFVLNDGTGLTVSGPLTAATSATIVDVGTLLVSGTIAPSAGSVIAVGLTAGALDIAGLVSDSGTGTMSLVSNAGTINETGTLIAGTLSGSAANGTLVAADLTGANGTVNQIGTLGAFSAGNFVLNDGTNLTIAGPVVVQTATVAVTGSMLVNGSIGACGSDGDTTLSATGLLTVASPALVWSLGGTVDLEAGSGFTQTGGLVNGQDVVVHAATGPINLSGGTIAAVNAVDVTATDGAINEAGGVVTANGSVSVLGTGDLNINSGVVIAGGSVALGTDGTFAMTGGEVAAGSDLTVGGDIGRYTGGDLVQSGGTLASGSLLTVLAGGNLSMTGGSRFAADLTADSNGASDTSLTGGAVSVATGGTLVFCDGLCVGTLFAGGSVAPSGTIIPGPFPGQTLVPGPLGSGAITIGGAAIIIDQPEIAGTVDLIAHGNTLTSAAGTINEINGGSVVATVLEGQAENGGSVTLNLATNQVGTLAAFSADGDFRFTDQTSLTIAGPVRFGLANTGSINTGSVAVLGSLTVPVGASVVGGSGTTTAGVFLDTGSAGGGIRIAGLVDAIGTGGNGGTISLTSAQAIDESAGTLVAWQLTGSTGNAATVTDASADFTGTSGTVFNNLIQTLGRFTGNVNGPDDGSVAAGIALTDGRDLTITGGVTANAGNIVIATHPGAGTAGSLTILNTGSVIATNAVQATGTAAGIPANGSISLAADGNVTVQGAVTGGQAGTVAITTDSAGVGSGATLTVDNTGTFAGVVSVQPYLPTGGSPDLVRPGIITLQTDALILNAGSAAAVSAPDGMVEIAPRTASHGISLDSVVANGATILSLGTATLGAIDTNGTMGLGLPSVGELVIGSLNGGGTASDGGITITAGFTLPSIQTLALFANGPIAETGGGALSVNALAGIGIDHPAARRHQRDRRPGRRVTADRERPDLSARPDPANQRPGRFRGPGEPGGAQSHDHRDRQRPGPRRQRHADGDRHAAGRQRPDDRPRGRHAEHPGVGERQRNGDDVAGGQLRVDQ